MLGLKFATFRNMTRNVTFWYTKELSIFENNEDLPTTKVDVTRMPAGECCGGRSVIHFCKENNS